MSIEAIESLADPRVACYRDVADRELRERAGLFLCEGRLNLQRLIAEGRFEVASVLITPVGLEALRSSLEKLPAATPIYVTSQAELNQVVGYNLHRGVIAVGRRGEPLAPESLAAPGSCDSLLLGLDSVSNPDNVGGAFRNAEAFGAHGVLLSPGCADPLARKTVRVSMGGALVLPSAVATDWPAALAALRARGYQIVGLDPRPDARELSRLASELRLESSGPLRVLLLVGREGEGLSAASRAACELRARIDMAPGVDSLNAATAAAIALFAFRQALASSARGGA
jgi:tRNA G18 (ribose-2'-O)-methylase SpoU